MVRTRVWSWVIIGLLGCPPAGAIPEKPVTGVPVADVRLLDGPFRDAQKRDLEYMLSLDPDRLLSGMRAASGLSPKAPLYGGWEKNGSGIVGHYLSACAWMTVATGDARIRQRMDYLVSEMASYQEKRGSGGLYASPWEANDWYAKLGKGDLRLSNVLPWYVGHKTLAGLRDAWLTGSSTQAKEVLIRYADWCAEITSKLSPKQWQDMTSKEIGAPNEVFADLYSATGNPRYLDLAKKFIKEPMVAALEKGDRAVLPGKHANTEIPLFVGYERTYEVTGEDRWHKAASNFWEAVIAGQTFAFGGNSIWEAFIQPAEQEMKLLEDCGPETCNTYNLLKLSRQLNELDPQPRYTDYIERAIYNHILTSIGPAPENGFTYYTPVRPGHYKRYSQPFDAFWCCVGSGMENHARYGSYIYATDKERLMVNLFIPSQMRWKEKEVELRQMTNFPEDGVVTFTIKTAATVEFTLSIRNPYWADKERAAMKLNGKSATVPAGASERIEVKRLWKNGDVLQVNLPPKLRAEFTPGGKYVSYFHGPVLLAAALGTEGLVPEDFQADGSKPFIQLGRKGMDQAKVPAVKGTRDNALSKVGNKCAGLSYPLDGAKGGVTLVPFSKIGLERYSVYFPLIR